jgi:Flp pilus assembly protein TadD
VGLRLLGAVTALLIALAFVIGIRQASSTAELRSLVERGGPRSAAQRRQAADDLRTAAFGYPGQDIGLLAAQADLNERRFRQAERTVLKVTRAEPQNVQAWNTLASVLLILGDRGARLSRAVDHLNTLDPIHSHR